MNMKKLFVGGIVGGIVYFLMGWLVYGKLLMDFMKKHSTMAGLEREPPLFLYLAIGNLLAGFLLAYIFVKSNVNSLGEGLVTGGIVGFLMCSGFDSIMYATTKMMGRTAVLGDVIAFTVISAIAGAVIGAVSGANKPA